MKVLSFTGGSTRGVGLSAIGLGIMETYEPDVIIGESVSAIFAIPLAMKKKQMIKTAMLNFTQKDVFGKFAPLNKKHSAPSFRGFFRAISGKESLGKQDALVDYIKKFLTKELFDEYVNGNYADVLVACVNYNTGLLEYFDLNQYEYEKALQIILASCNIPVLINGVKIGGCYYYDGGVISAQSGKQYLKDNAESITEFRSLWARAAADKFKVKLSTDYKPTNILKPITRSVKLMIASESLESEYLEDLLCKVNRIEHRKYFFETELDSLYDNDDDKYLDWNNGLKIGRKI